MKLLARLRLWSIERRKRAQHRDVHSRLLRAWSRLDELRAYVDHNPELKRPLYKFPRKTPKVVGTADSFEVLLPGEPGYDEA